MVELNTKNNILTKVQFGYYKFLFLNLQKDYSMGLKRFANGKSTYSEQ